MTQPPFDPYGRPVDPAHYPQAGPVGPHSPYPHSPAPMSPYPGQMRNVDQHTTALVRPDTVVVAFALWVLAALSWPVGSLVRSLSEEEALIGFGSIMALFAGTCLAVAGVWGAVLLLGGSYHARLGLCGGSLVIGVLALAAAIVAGRDGDTEPLSWVVIVLRLVLPLAASAFSFLPGTRQFFSGNHG